MKISDILDECKLTLLAGSADREIKGYYACDLLSRALSHANEGDLWVTVMNNINILAVATLVDVSCVVIPEDIETPQALIAKAKEKGITLLSSPLQGTEIIIKAHEFSKNIG